MAAGTSWWLRSKTVTAGLTAAYVFIGLIFALTDRNFHDEGLLTYYWAAWVRQDWAPVLFLQKTKPVLAALYAPVSGAGIRATMIAHVVLAATAIPALAATARRLGHALPNLPALAMAVSPLYLFGGSSGLSNVDGAAGVALAFCFLTGARQPWLGGFVAGVLPWVRFELGLMTAAVGAWAFFVEPNRRRSVLLGLASFPLLYALAGALYHEDLLWLWNFPPAVPKNLNDPMYGIQNIGLPHWFRPALALTPLAPFVASVRLRDLRQEELLVFAFLVAGILGVHLLPMFEIGSFGSAERYSLHLLPAGALLMGRGFSTWWDNPQISLRRIAVIAALALWMATRQASTTMVAPFLVVTLLIMLLARTGRREWMALLVVVFAFTGPLWPVHVDVGRKVTAPYLDPAVAWIEQNQDVMSPAAYTNMQLLAPFLKVRGISPRTSVHMLLGDDMRDEINSLTNSANGQRQRLWKLAESNFYGRGVVNPVSPADLPAGSLVFQRKSIRLSVHFPQEIWGEHLETLFEDPWFRVARVRSVPSP